jgi:carbon storage regulator
MMPSGENPVRPAGRKKGEKSRTALDPGAPIMYSCSRFPTSRRTIAVLVLSRKPGEKIHIGEHITVVILEVKGGRIRVGVEAPEDVEVLRGELQDLARGTASDS